MEMSETHLYFHSIDTFNHCYVPTAPFPDVSFCSYSPYVWQPPPHRKKLPINLAASFVSMKLFPEPIPSPPNIIIRANYTLKTVEGEIPQ